MSETKEKLIKVSYTSTSIRLKEKFKIELAISGDYGFINEAIVLINQQNATNEREIKMQYLKTENNINYFSSDINLENLGIYYFCIKLIINNELKWIKYNNQMDEAIITEQNFPFWTVTVYDEKFEVPKWAQGKIMYHIFVDRFYRSKLYKPCKIKNRKSIRWGKMPKWKESKNKRYNNYFYLGNLKGIEEKIEYLKKLGVEIVFLSPICMSQSNHRYDTADYENVDPYLGSNKDLESLCTKLHENNMKIIIDAAFNHTGNDSKYFNEYNSFNTIGAYQSKTSKYYNWYKKNENGEFMYWWGFKNLPVCDGENKEWQQYIYGENGIIDKWFKLGIDGLRLDVADELTDDFIKNIRKAVKRNKNDGFIIGEVWENAITKEKDGIQRKYLLGDGLDSVMNYPFTNAILKFVRFGKYELLLNTLNEIIKQYPKETTNSLMNSLSTHDITRAMTTLAGKGIKDNDYNSIWDIDYDRQWQEDNDCLNCDEYNQGKELIKIATTIQYFLPGNPCIYYGDETGMCGYKDPFNRKCVNWKNIDTDLYNFYVTLGQIRKENPFLSEAEINIIQANENCLVFERKYQDEKILIGVNRTKNIIKIDVPEKYKKSQIIFSKNYKENNLEKYGIIILK